MTKESNIDIFQAGNGKERYITDENLRKFLKEGVRDIRLSEMRKHTLELAVRAEAARCQEGFAKRVWCRIHEFMETTFEISLAPVATTLGIVLVAITAVSYGFLGSPSDIKTGVPVAYIGQTITNPDGSAHIVFIPVDRGRAKIC